jgi:hypothetical protein
VPPEPLSGDEHEVRQGRLGSAYRPRREALPGECADCDVGADCRAAGTDPASRGAFTFLVVGLHDSQESADGLLEEVVTVVPWFADAAERWSGVPAPFRTKGESPPLGRWRRLSRCYEGTEASARARLEVASVGDLAWRASV